MFKIYILLSHQWWVHQSGHHVSVKLTHCVLWGGGASRILDDLVDRLPEKAILGSHQVREAGILQGVEKETDSRQSPSMSPLRTSQV